MHSLLESGILVVAVDHLRFRIHEWLAVVVELAVQNDTEGVLVRQSIIRLRAEHLRGHVGERPFHRQAPVRLVHLPGLAKIPQLELSLTAHHDVLRLDIAVQDPVLCTGLQRIAHADAQPYDLIFIHFIQGDVSLKGR